MNIKIQIIKQDTLSKNILFELFNSTNNPTSCSFYGGGTHCSSPTNNKTTQIRIKWAKWGKRGDESVDSNPCAVARVFIDDKEDMMALFNVGFSGEFPTVVNANKPVHELSPLFVTEKYVSSPLQTELITSILTSLVFCEKSEGHGSGFVTFTPNFPHQDTIFSTYMCGTAITENVTELNIHPERFTFINGKSFECTDWNSENVVHEGWHNSTECTNFVHKDAYLLEALGQYPISQHDEYEELTT